MKHLIIMHKIVNHKQICILIFFQQQILLMIRRNIKKNQFLLNYLIDIDIFNLINFENISNIKKKRGK